METKEEMKKIIDGAVLETVRLKYTYFDDKEDQDYAENQFTQTIEWIAMDLNKECIEQGSQLKCLLKDLGFDHETKILEKSIAFVNRELDDPKVSVGAAFDALESDSENKIDSLFAAKEITDAKIKNKGFVLK
jgi:hypothetical protein